MVMSVSGDMVDRPVVADRVSAVGFVPYMFPGTLPPLFIEVLTFLVPWLIVGVVDLRPVMTFHGVISIVYDYMIPAEFVPDYQANSSSNRRPQNCRLDIMPYRLADNGSGPTAYCKAGNSLIAGFGIRSCYCTKDDCDHCSFYSFHCSTSC